MKTKVTLIIVVFAAICITVFLGIINHIALSVRLNEMKTSLQDLDHREGSVDHIGLVATYEIHKKIYEERLEHGRADAIEQRLDTLIMREKEEARLKQSGYGIILMPAVWMINLNRKVLGKKPLHYSADSDAVTIDLDVAYYFERNFLFKRAIQAYDKVLNKRGIDDALRASVLLHQGYCYALAGINNKAKGNYQTIIRDFGRENSAITATILSSYMEGFARARERVLGSVADPLLRSRKLVNLMAYEQALEILEKEETVANPRDLPFIRYTKARCYSGIGRPAKAAETYLAVITGAPSSEYARLSNRKLFAIGSRAGGDNAIRRVSIRINERLKDPVITEMLGNQKELPPIVPEAYRISDIEITERILRQADIFASKAEKPSRVDRFLVIETSDGNTFKGTVIEDTGEHIALMTSIGRINVKKNRVTRISEKK